MHYKIITVSLALFFISLLMHSQPKCFFEHYGSEEGLPQHTVMSILQDKKGFMWFSTWNGLSKFDGYDFHNYKIQSGDLYHMRSDRIDFIGEDKYGYIWTLTYDNVPHRFDPRSETFMGLQSVDKYKNFSFYASKIIPFKSGRVWLISDKMGCVCVTDSTFKVEVYNTENNTILGNNIYSVYEDSEYNSWILSDNGLYLISNKDGKINSFFTEKQMTNNHSQQEFHSAIEINNEIWFSSNNGRIWIYNKKNKRFRLFETNTTSGIGKIKAIADNLIIITTFKDGFFIYNLNNNISKKYNKLNLPELCSNDVLSCYIDQSKRIWLELNCYGISRFDVVTEKISTYKMDVEETSYKVFTPKQYIFEDIEQRLWIHVRGGGFGFYDAEKDKLIPFYNEPQSLDWKFSNTLHSAFSDQQGNLWLGTRSCGLEKITFYKDFFKSMVVDSNIHSTINNDIRCIFEDKNENLWVTSKGSKIFVYDKNQVQRGYITKDGDISFDTPLAGTTYCIMQDDKQNIWLGTKEEGLYKLTPKTNGKYDITQYKNASTDLYSLSSNSVYSIFQDNKKRIWIGTYGGGLNLLDDEATGRFINHKNNLKDYPILHGSQIRIISNDKFGNICIGTTMGLIMFSSEFKNINDIEYKFYVRKLSDNKSLSANDIYDICTTKDGITYIATFGGGLNTIKTVDKEGFPTTFSSLSTANGLASDVLLSAVEDLHGNLWITSESNLTKYDPKNGIFTTYSEISRLIDSKNFSEGARCISKSGLVYLGFSKGFVSINPDKVKANSFKPYVALTGFQISNKDVPIGTTSPLSMNIDDMKSIKLNHKQNFINIHFAALDFIDPQLITYAYKLDGFDENWIITKKQRTANYTNLAPGKYTFRVKSTNSDGVWVDNEHIIEIEITPSFWQTSFAYLIYIILFIAVLYLILRTIFTFYRLQDKIKLEHEQTEMKTRFFTDISHEIRTPLTMIVSPVENIIENDQTSTEVKSQLQLVLKNANRMLRMVNQILDFRKIQKKKLDIQETEFAVFVEDICNNFREIADKKNIDLIVKENIGQQSIWIDKDSIEKLVFNLLSNAFKYSTDGKKIEVTLSNNTNTINLQIKDQGQGMPKNLQTKLFTRFLSFNKDKSKPSTGIGLSIVKEVADKHHAKIGVDSEIGKGTTFNVLFQKGFEHFKSDTDINFAYDDDGATSEVQSEKYELTDDSDQVNTTDNDLQTILVVEDNTDLRQFIRVMLTPYYHILEADNGKDGYKVALNELPDFILSDIMMPETDGVEFLQLIRNNADTSHIPFILLTAKTDMETKLTSLDYGADDYITKPFSVKYLKARIENIIQQRKLLYDVFNKQNDNSTTTPDENSNESGTPIMTSKDQLFLKKIEEEVENNIDNSNFFIDDLISSVAMSRTVFVKKLKSLTGLTPLEFVKDIKIKHAAKLIDTQEYSIKEVAFMVGISDTKYFTQCFKKIYGVTPTEYKNREK